MHNLKQHQFENFKEIAEHYKEEDNFQLFSEYCHYQEIGLRKISLQKINQFVKMCETLPFETQKQICLNLLSLLYNHTMIYQLPSYALTTYLLQFLQKWENISKPSAIIYQWQGFLKKDETLFIKGLISDPTNQICLSAVIKFNLDRTYYWTHHLDESVCLGDLDQAFQTLDYIQTLIPQVFYEKDRQYYIKEFEEYSMLIRGWNKYSDQKLTLSFYDLYNNQPEYQQNPLGKGITVYYHPKKSK